MMACVGLCPLRALREISWRPDKAWVGLHQVFAVSLRRNTRINQKGRGGKLMGKFFFSLEVFSAGVSLHSDSGILRE